MKIGILQVGYGNLSSITKSLRKINLDAFIVENAQDLKSISHLIIPGVGSFPFAMEMLEGKGYIEEISNVYKSGNLRILGICLGAQLLFQSSEEIALTPGLSFIEGNIVKINSESDTHRLPHTGWNDVEFTRNFGKFKEGQFVPFYFNHSYRFDNLKKENVIAKVQYGEAFPVIVKCENIMGVQFHPEKSQIQGHEIIREFLEL